MATFELRLRGGIGDTMTFTCPDDGGEVRLENVGRAICIEGKFDGTPVRVANATDLPAAARKWWRTRQQSGREWRRK